MKVSWKVGTTVATPHRHKNSNENLINDPTSYESLALLAMHSEPRYPPFAFFRGLSKHWSLSQTHSALLVLHII